MLHLAHNRIMFLFIVLAVSLAAPIQAQEPETVSPDATMLRFPDVGREKIVFLFANDLWVVDRDGGQAVPLASPPGEEGFPKFSPDGETIAFVGNYDGGRDLYTLPVTGGVPHRVTHHPSGETLCDWTPDGKLLFYTSGLSGLNRRPKLYTVSREGGLPEVLPVPYGAAGAISPDGKFLAYTPHTRDTRSWKRYRGGMATDIWLFDLETSESKMITDWEGTDTLPMWHGGKVYYLSDNGSGSKLNIWSYDIASGSREQVTHLAEYDVKWPSMGPGESGEGEIIFQHGPSLYLLDLSTSLSREIKVTIPGARPMIRTKSVDASEYINAWGISSTGKRAAVEARGDIWTLPAEHGSPRNLTRTSGVAERMPSWSPDGKWIAYFSDASGEYELYITQSDGKGETKQLTEGSKNYYYSATWSPDSKRIAFNDKAGAIHLHDIEKGETKTIDTDPWGMRTGMSWSHDSRWIAYSRTGETRRRPAVWLYDVEKGEAHKVTSGMFADTSPVFDRKGDYLYYASSRSFSPTYSDVDGTFIYNESQVLLAAPLLEEIEYPWLPESDEEKWDAKGKDQDKDKEKKEEDGEDEEADEESDGEKSAAKPVADDGVSGTWEGTAVTPDGPLAFTATIQLHSDNSITGSLSSTAYSGELTGSYDASSRTLSLTFSIPDGPTIEFELKIDNGSMAGKWFGDGDEGSVTASRSAAGGGEEGENGKEKGKGKKEKAREKVEVDLEGFERRTFQLPVARGNYGGLVVNDKNQLIYYRAEAGIKLFDIKDKKKEEKSVSSSGRGFTISGDGKKLLVIQGRSASIQNAAAGGAPKKVVTDGMTAYIDPREEWRQLFIDAWRIERDFFYVDNLHGVDWPAVRMRYGKMLEHCSTREEVSYVIREMISELNIGHAYYSGGDVEDQPRMSVGMLGVDWALENGAYRIKKIFEGGPWDTDARNPLNRTGIAIKEGDYLLAVNGVEVDPTRDPWAAFLGLSGQAITVTVSEEPSPGDKTRDVVVQTMGSEGNLRYRAWIESNRAYVDQKTQGRVGYIYVPNTGRNGQTDLVRQYFAQIDRMALIIDERWNGGGQIPDRFIEMLNRPVSNYWARRHGKESPTPSYGHQGPKCMLINGLAGSGGDMFPWLFRHAGLGKLIGTRTWGGLVGMSGNPRLIDGGRVTVPTFGFFETDGTWGVEGHGVDPDIKVIDDPALMVDGGDPQLDAAIAHMLAEIESSPYIPPKRPADPDRSGMGIKEADK